MPTLPQHPVAKTPFNLPAQVIPSSSPAFATPLHPIRPALAGNKQDANRPAPILPILLPPATLRPIAFRTFTKKHNLTLTASALQALATFVGKHCGSGWREEGLAELVLEEIARSWKRAESKVIVDGEGTPLKNILKQLEGSMSGGRIVIGRSGSGLTRVTSLAGRESSNDGIALNRQDSFGMSTLEVEEEDESEEKDPRSWIKVISASEQPRMIYNPTRNHFEKSKTTLDLFPPPSLKTELFRQRYHLIHQRVLRNESFQKATVGAKTTEWKITPIANLLGRSGTGHLILGLLTIAPTGTLAISDLSGTILLDLDQATSIDAVETWLCPGMIVLVDGVYEEEYSSAGGNLGGTGGIGGTIGGRLTGFSVGAPRCEMRAATLGITDAGNIDSQAEHHIGGGFGWVDFLGIGSERAIGSRMRKIEQRLLRPRAPQSLNASLSSQAHEHANSNKMVILGEVNLDNAICLMALRRILLTYAPPLSSTAVPPPITFVLLGNFVSHAAMSNTASSSTSSATTIPDSITYKESFDALAALLSDFPGLLHSSIWIFVPGDNDPWASAFSSGASVPLPRNAIPDMFTTRVKRAFATANAAPGAALGATSKDRVQGEAVWTTNPARLSLFGTSNEIVLFRDDISGRLRRTSVPLKPSGEAEDEGYGSDERNRQDQRREEVSSTMMSGALDNEDAMDIDGNAHAADDDVVVIDADTPVTTATRKAGPSSTVRHARSLTKTLLDQAHLSPFPLATRPLHWSYAHSLSLYPLPSALVLCDTDADAFVVKYQGCCVMNAGRILGGRGGAGKGGKRGGREISWIEYDVLDRNAEIRYGDL